MMTAWRERRRCDATAETQVTTDTLRLTFDDTGQLKMAISCFPACSGEAARVQLPKIRELVRDERRNLLKWFAGRLPAKDLDRATRRRPFALVLGGGFLYYAIQLMKGEDDSIAMKTFGYSIWYLMALFTFLLVDHYLPLIV